MTRAAGSVLLLAALAAGCSTARLPPRAALVEPCRVFLLQTPIHPVLVLPDGAGRFVGYAFGDRTFMSTFDWRQYPWGAWLFFAGLPGEFTRGAMERVRYRGVTRDELARESGMEADELVVERARVDALRRRLESKVGPAVPGHESWLFATDDRYSVWWDNCHGATAAWLRELGADVPRLRLVPRWAGWSIRQ